MTRPVPVMGCVDSKGATGGFWEKETFRDLTQEWHGFTEGQDRGHKPLPGPGGASEAAEEETEEPGICPAQPAEAHGQGRCPAPAAGVTGETQPRPEEGDPGPAGRAGVVESDPARA